MTRVERNLRRSLDGSGRTRPPQPGGPPIDDPPPNHGAQAMAELPHLVVIPVLARTARRIEALATARCLQPQELAAILLEIGLNLEQLPEPEPKEDAKAYRERVQRTSDGGA